MPRDSQLILWQFLNNLENEHDMIKIPIDVKNIHTICWTYYIHGVMMEMLGITYLCAASRKIGLMRNLVLSPSSTSPTSPSSSLASHIHCFTTSNLCKYLIMNPKHPSHMYPLAIETFGLAILHTYNFKVFMYLFTRYIHLVTTNPHISNSSARWYNKCVMMSKMEGGKWISNKVKLIATSMRSDLISKRFQTLLQSLLNTLEILMIAIQGLGTNKPLNANGIIYCINTW